jgi:pimeloyl-ACP methyl ester carboxylesterase
MTTPTRLVAGYLRKYPFAPRYPAGQRLALVTADGVRLAGGYVPGPPDATATVVVVHGFVHSSRTPAIHAFARDLAGHVHVVVPDLRGHGASGGRSTLGIQEAHDVAAGVHAARVLHPELPVVTFGVSLGAAAALQHAGRWGGVAGVFALSAPAYFVDDTIGTRRVRRWVEHRAGRLALAGVLRTRVAREWRSGRDNREAVAAIAPAFTVLIHDPDDWYFDGEHARLLHEWAGPPKALWWYPGGGHGTDLLRPALARRVVVEISARLGSGAAIGAPGRDEGGTPGERGDQRDRAGDNAHVENGVDSREPTNDQQQQPDGARDDGHGEAGMTGYDDRLGHWSRR